MISKISSEEDLEKIDKNLNSEQLNNLEVENNPTKDFAYFLFDLFKTGVVVFIIAFALRYFAVQPFIVDGESMMPNFVNNEYLLAEKISYTTGEPKRGDVTIFRYPKNPNVSYIKRIIGLPGETVKIKDNTVTIINSNNPDGINLDEAYLSAGALTLATGTETGSFSATMGDNEYFVMGDNRQHSSDSREWGVLPKANIIGRAWLTITPTEKFGLQKRISYPGLNLSKLVGKALANR
jgi:signal peptidase I